MVRIRDPKEQAEERKPPQATPQRPRAIGGGDRCERTGTCIDESSDAMQRMMRRSSGGSGWFASDTGASLAAAAALAALAALVWLIVRRGRKRAAVAAAGAAAGAGTGKSIGQATGEATGQAGDQGVERWRSQPSGPRQRPRAASSGEALQEAEKTTTRRRLGTT